MTADKLLELIGSLERSWLRGGALLLLYLAAGALRQWRQPTSPTSQASTPRTLLEAALVNLLNPNPYLAWALVLGPSFTVAWSHGPANAIAFAGSFYVTMVLTLAAFIFLAGTARFLSPSRRRALVGASGLLLAGLGVALLVMGVRGVWRGA